MGPILKFTFKYSLKVLMNNNNKISRNTTMRTGHKNIENQWDNFDTLIFN